MPCKKKTERSVYPASTRTYAHACVCVCGLTSDKLTVVLFLCVCIFSSLPPCLPPSSLPPFHKLLLHNRDLTFDLCCVFTGETATATSASVHAEPTASKQLHSCTCTSHHQRQEQQQPPSLPPPHPHASTPSGQ